MNFDLQSFLHFIVYTAAHGFGAQDLGLAIIRIGVGVFFAISGFNKLFNPGRHQSLTNNLTKNGIPCVWFMQWWVPGWEFVSGVFLAIGFMTAFNAGVLFIICVVACACEARRRVEAYHPINFGDRIACWLYLPEVMYLFMLAVNILAGTGVYSVDALIWPITQ